MKFVGGERENNMMIGSSVPTLQPETMCLVIQHLSFALRHTKHLYAYIFNVNWGFFLPQMKDSKQWKS